MPLSGSATAVNNIHTVQTEEASINKLNQARSQGGGGGGGGGRPPPPLEARRALFGALRAPKRADETARSAVFREFRGP